MAKKQQQQTLRPFGARDKFGYLFGDFGNDFTFIFSTTALTKFYTDVMGISPALVGTIMMLARFVDAVTDTTMGRIADRGKVTPNGKFKPWILRMCVPVAAASFLMYQYGLAGMPYGFKVSWLIVTYLLWGSFCYTGINIPYGSMASAISANPSDRQSLSTFRTMGGMCAGMVIGIIFPMFAYEKVDVGNGVTQDVMVGSRVTLMAGIFSVLAIVCYLLCYKLTTERVVPEVAPEAQKNNSLGRTLLNAVKNRALISIIVASICMLLAQLTMQSMTSYIYPDYYNNASAASLSTVCMMVGMLISAVIAKPVAAKFGKAEMSVASCVVAVVVNLLLFIIRPSNVYVFIVFQFICWFALGMFSMVTWALITDVIDDAEIRNGIREDGSIYGLYSFARKLGQALASGLSGWLLTAIGYDGEILVQPDSVKNGIFNISTLVPLIGFAALALILWFWYPLHKKKVDENVAILAAKRESENKK